jgi:hypothetical protein
MNYTNRINYYLGKNLIEKKIDIKTAKFTTIKDCDTTLRRRLANQAKGDMSVSDEPQAIWDSRGKHARTRRGEPIGAYFEDLCNLYANPLKKLVIKTGNDKKKFCCQFGDIDCIVGPINLVKNRCDGNEDSVILRCLNTSRHWGNYYSKPQDIQFEKKRYMRRL